MVSLSLYHPNNRIRIFLRKLDTMKWIRMSNPHQLLKYREERTTPFKGSIFDFTPLEKIKHYHCMIYTVFSGELFIIEKGDFVDTVYRFSLITGNHLSIYSWVETPENRAIVKSKLKTLKICPQSKNPDDLLFLWMEENSSGFFTLFCNDPNIEKTWIVTDNLKNQYFAIDPVKRFVYFSQGEQSITEFDITTRIRTITEFNDNLDKFDFDQDQNLLILWIGRKCFRLNSFNPETGEVRQLTQKPARKFNSPPCCCQGGYLARVGQISLYGAQKQDRAIINFYGHDQPTRQYIEDSVVIPIAFDWTTGSIILTNKTAVVIIIHPDQWISTSPSWKPDNHHSQPIEKQTLIKNFTMIRSLQYDHVISLLPNELLFEIFKYL